MSMSTYVKGFRDMDGKFKVMMEAKEFCESRKLSYPKEVLEYFGSDVVMDKKYLLDLKREVEIKSRGYEASGEQGIEIDIKDLPPDVRTIRFINSY